jgi:hypothetical protein
MEGVIVMRYSMTCSCGDEITARARTREKAVKKMKVLLNEAKVYEHMAQKHMRDIVPSIEHVHEVIEQNLKDSA